MSTVLSSETYSAAQPVRRVSVDGDSCAGRYVLPRDGENRKRPGGGIPPVPGRSFPAVGTRSSGKVMFCGDSLRQWDEKEPPPNRQRLLHIDKSGRGHPRETTAITDQSGDYLDAAIVPAALVFTWAAINVAA